VITDARVAELERRIKSRRARPDTERRLALQVIERLRVTDRALKNAAEMVDSEYEASPETAETTRLQYILSAIDELKDERTPHADPR
jgi:rRNA-processing protein FCF1